MLVLGRKEGQWLEVTHRSGDVLRIKVLPPNPRFPDKVNIGFEDEVRNFEIARRERLLCGEGA